MTVAGGESNRIKRMACRVPVPLAGLMLGLASAGNMVPSLRWLFGPLAFLCLLLLATRIALDAHNFRVELRNPAVVGIVCTIPMGVSVLSTYMEPFLPTAALAIWIAAVLAHVVLIVYFTAAFMLRPDVKKFVPSYFVVYVGIAVGAVVAPVYGAYSLGQGLFWFGLISYLVLLPLIFYKVAVHRSVPEPLLPTVAIFAAPASLCLAGYLRSFDSKDLLLVSALFGLALASYLAVLLYLPKLLRLRFYPSCSAFTFPLVISAVATSATYAYLKEEGIDLSMLQFLAWGQIGLALLLIAFVLIRYADHFLLRRVTKAR